MFFSQVRLFFVRAWFALLFLIAGYEQARFNTSKVMGFLEKEAERLKELLPVEQSGQKAHTPSKSMESPYWEIAMTGSAGVMVSLLPLLLYLPDITALMVGEKKIIFLITMFPLFLLWTMSLAVFMYACIHAPLKKKAHVVNSISHS